MFDVNFAEITLGCIALTDGSGVFRPSKMQLLTVSLKKAVESCAGAKYRRGFPRCLLVPIRD